MLRIFPIELTKILIEIDPKRWFFKMLGIKALTYIVHVITTTHE